MNKTIISCGRDDLSDSDIEEVVKHAPKFFIYEYESEPFEGSGYAFFRSRDGKFDYECLGHCSCYGPLENFYGSARYETVADLLGFCTDDLKTKLAPLIERAKKEGLMRGFE